MRNLSLGSCVTRWIAVPLHRSWNHVYAVQHGISLAFYKDKKSKLQEITFQKEAPIDLTNAEVEVAHDYTKKKHVFRLK